MFEFFKQLKAEKLRTIGELEKEMVEVERGIREKYEAQPKTGLLNKIGFVEKRNKAKQEEAILREVNRYKTTRLYEINKAYSDKKKAYINEHKFRCIFAPIGALLIVISLIGFVGEQVYKEDEQKYNLAIESVSAHDYDTAEKSLKDIDYKDSKEIVSFCKINKDYESYKGKQKKLISKLEDIKFEDEKMSDIRAKVINDIKKTEECQNDISKIKLASVSLDDESEMSRISKSYNSIPKYYRVLMDNSKLKKMNLALDEIKRGTKVGLVIAGISELHNIKLESDARINAIRQSYNALSDKEKKSVINISKLNKS